MKVPVRMWIGIMVFFCTWTCYMLRGNINVSIVDMVDRKAQDFTPVCRRHINVTKYKEHRKPIEKKITHEKHDWDEIQVGLIQGAYTVGSLITVIPAGIVSDKIGAWHVIMWCSVEQAILNALTPLSAKLGHWGVVGTRFLMGLGGGAIYPAVNSLISKWAPPQEKGRFLAAMMGNTLGTVFTYSTVGAITYSWGWQWAFYFLTIWQAIFCLIFAFVVADSPDKHPWISEEEKNFIIGAQGSRVKKKKDAPYRKILTSFPFWVLCGAQFGNLWNLNLTMTYATKLLTETMGLDLYVAGTLSSTPYLARMILSVMFGTIGDYIQQKNLMSLSASRKFFIIFSHLLPAVCLALMTLTKCDYVPVVVLLVLNQGFNSALVASHLLNAQDISPNFAGTVYGIMNFVGTTTGLFVPVITGVVNDYYDMELIAVTVVASLGAGVIGLTGILFILFSSVKVQSWNQLKEEAIENQ